MLKLKRKRHVSNLFSAKKFLSVLNASLETGKNFQMKIWSQWYKNTAVNYRGNFNPAFLGLKYRGILLPLCFIT
jgi:hypothetical protein